MAKNRNKGFSLIEVIIGVAVLTILLTPVVKQLAQTMQTNRLAKEQQYVNECATSLMEYTQKTSFDSLATVPSDTSTSGLYLTSAATTSTEFCEIYVYDTTGSTPVINPIGYYLDTGDTTFAMEGSTRGVKYTSKVYNMNDVNLGSKQTAYTRTIVLDDLTNKLSSISFKNNKDEDKTCGLNVLYGLSSLDGITLPSSEGSEEEAASGKYELTSEGSIVKYGTKTVNEVEVSYVKGIVCTIKGESDVIEDPNESQIGSMHDLVSTQMALVNGAISDYDATAREALHTEMLDVIKTNAPDTYDQIQNNETMNLDSYLNGFVKSIYITIDKDDSDPFNQYYKIYVNVAYDATFNIAGKTYSLDTMEYNVFAQTYRYEGDAPTVPAVYIEYQPFLIDEIGYATSEYIYIENYVDDATIYMYKPTKDYVYSSGNYYGSSSATPYVDEEEELNAIYDSKKESSSVYSQVYNQTGYSNVPVNIYINSLKSDNGRGETTNGKVTNLYTNLDVTKNSSTNKYGQFILNSSLADTVNYQNFTVTQDTAKNTTTSLGSSDAPVLRLLAADKDTSNSDRLYTATIKVAPKTSTGVNAVTLTGAKGGN